MFGAGSVVKDVGGSPKSVDVPPGGFPSSGHMRCTCMASETEQRLCYKCEEKPREDGDLFCKSCKEGHRECFECGQRERNYPFKLCTVCYQQGRGRASSAVSIPTVTTSVVTTAAPVAPSPVKTTVPVFPPKVPNSEFKSAQSSRVYMMMMCH